MASTGKQWYVGEDGCIPIGELANSVTYHSALNSIIVTTNEPAVKIYDVTSGSVLQKSNLCAPKDEQIRCMYLPERNKVVFHNSSAIGVRSDLHGVLMLDTALQIPVYKPEEYIRLELPLAEASQLLKSLSSADLSSVEYTELVVKELEKKIEQEQEATKGNHKTTKWATVCIEVPHCALKAVTGSLVTEMRSVNVHSPGLSIASAVTDRLGYLLPSSAPEPSGSTVERTLMYSEAARRETFINWPHMNYKWALPDPMAQAGFYHQPNVSGDDRAMCFTCNVCLVCWEPTDEPWSEHERHSPSCPFVKGEHTQNVPLSVTYATQPALAHSDGRGKIECVSVTASEDYIATAGKHGNIVVWNLKRKMKKHCEFVIDVPQNFLGRPTGSQAQKQGCTPESNAADSHAADSLGVGSSKGAESVQDDQVDAKVTMSDPVAFSVGEDVMEPDTTVSDSHVADCNVSNGMNLSFVRPNENLLVSSMCLVEKQEPDVPPVTQSQKGKRDKKGKVKKCKTQVQPSLICGVSVRKSKHPANCEDEGGGMDEQTEVQFMNKVNEAVSGETSPLITNISNDQVSQTEFTTDEILDTKNFIPCILVVAVKEDIKKVSKEASTDSLKLSASTNNIVPTLDSVGINQDWQLLDSMYDSDVDCQIVKVTGPMTSLSTSSPTEGTKLIDPVEAYQGPSSTKAAPSIPERAIKRSSSKTRAGSLCQYVELPQELQREHLHVTSIRPTLDRQHLVVVVSPRCSAKSFPCSAKSSNSKETDTSDKSESEVTSSGFAELESGQSFSDSTEVSSAGFSEGNTNASSMLELKSDYSSSHGCILVYKFSYDCDNYSARIEDKPVCVRPVDVTEAGVECVQVLPRELSDQTDDDDRGGLCEEELFGTSERSTIPAQSKVLAGGVYGQMAVIFTSGKLCVLNCSDLSVVATIEPVQGDRFLDVTYCSGIDRLCLCSSLGKLHFYQLSEDTPDQSDSVLEGEMTPSTETIDSVFSSDSLRPDTVQDQAPRASVSELLAKQQLTFESVSQLHNLIQFENLMPRFTATVPPCWTEIQQEQQQRRHPQHLQHQGEATQHTRTWKLQPDGGTWDEHLFEIVLPKVCCVGHVDVKFTLNPLCTSTPKIQVTLLKQNINAIGRQNIHTSASAHAPVDSKINFNFKPSYNSDESDSSSSSGSQSPPVINNVLDLQFLESHNAEILCGPVNIANCLDLSGSGGIVSLTSPQLLICKPRSFLLHIKGFPGKKKEPSSEKGKAVKKKCTGTASQVIDKAIKSFVGNYTTASKAKIDNFKGCDWITELSITIRKTRKTNLPKERLQRNAMIELTSFHEKLLSTVSFDEGFLLSGVSPDHVQNMSLDILIWISNIQMNDPDKRLQNKCILTILQQRLKKIVQTCYIQGTRTTAHKCSRLLSVCMEYSKLSADPDLAPTFSLHLLEALVDCLPLMPCAYSAGALKWFFTLLNRVKCMDVTTVSARCSELLANIAKHFHERAFSLHALLKARYGLNGHPFEADLFDMELPQAVRQIVPGSQSAFSFPGTINTTTSSGASSSGSASMQNQQQDELDFYDLFNNPPEKSTKSVMECARNHILGMLEVEPLHFTCHSTSDGTKMERLDNTTGVSASTVINSGGLGSSGLGMSETINFGEIVPSVPFNYIHLPPLMPDHSKQQLLQEWKNEGQSLAQMAAHSKWLMPPTPKTTPQLVTPPYTPPNEGWHQGQIEEELYKGVAGLNALLKKEDSMLQQMLGQTYTHVPGKLSDSPHTSVSIGKAPGGEGSNSLKPGHTETPKVNQQRPSMNLQQTHHLLQPPAPQVLVIERIYSGARRFVILDFGKPILLTDVIIPLCGDLASLSIDVWVQGEEVDGQRIIVASDIGVRSLVMNNIMPPPVCRFLKITTIGRYGSGTTRSKIPIGAFYGHSYILPWEWSSRSEHHVSPTTSSIACQLDFPTQSQLLAHLSNFISLLEDIQCRYSLARSRLEALLVQVESLQYANLHTQYYLKKTKKNDEDNNIIQAYNDCLQLQLQQNLAKRAIDRLQSAMGLRLPTTQYPDSSQDVLRQAPTDKLRFLLENLLETLISMTNSSPSIPRPPTSLYVSLDHQACQDLFKHLCFHGTPRVQILTGMVLVRVCGSQAWFGDFLGNMIQEYFSSETVQVFSQDRVFILLTAMGQRALQGPCAVSIMESLLSMLARVLSPALGGPGGAMHHTGQLDLSLIGWILLFLCRNLDNTIVTNSNGDEEGAAKKDQGSNLSNRWNFIQANSNVRSQAGKSKSFRLYRRSLKKRLLIHKQKLMDLEHVKKNFLAQDAGNNTLLKQQEKLFRKELSQYASKHLKDIIQMRKNDAEVLRKLPRDERGAAAAAQDDRDSLMFEPDTVLTLPKDKCLPVVHRLMALLLGMDITCNVDLFLVTCKVLARVCIATRPAVTLSEAMTLNQLEQLIMLAANLEFNHGNVSWGGPWAGHALTCLLQDILEGERVYPSTQYDGITDDDISASQAPDMDGSLASSSSLPNFDVLSETPEPTEAASESKDDPPKFSISSAIDMLMDDGESNDDMSEKLHAYVTGENIPPPPPPQPEGASASTTTLSNMISNQISSQHKDKPDKEGVSVLKAMKAVFGSTGYSKSPAAAVHDGMKQAINNTSAPTPTGQGLSTALDSRLELGLETQAELRLRVMLSLQSDMLQGAFTSQLPVPPRDALHRHSNQAQTTPTDDELSESMSGVAQGTSFEMLSQAYDNLFSQLLLQRVNMDTLLQLWLTLNEEPSLDGSDPQMQFDATRTPIIPLSVNSITNLLACVATTPSLQIRTWVLVFESLSLLTNLKLDTMEDHRSMAIAMMGDSNLVTIITKFLSGTVTSGPATSFESHSQVGPSAVKAFHVFLQRLHVCMWHCGEDNVRRLKEIMLKLVYSLTAERGAFHSSLGPLDAQCKFLEFILELKYDVVDVNNAISVIESISTKVHQHILCQERVTCRSTSDNGINARSCFGGLFANLLRGGEASGRNGDYSRDLLMCSLLKLVNTLIQIQFPAWAGRRVSMGMDGVNEPHTPTEPMTDSTKLSQALATSTPIVPAHTSQSDEEKFEQTTNSNSEQMNGQTDEQKTENANQERGTTGSEGTDRALADIVLGHQGIMCNLIQALSYCTSNTMAVILGSTSVPNTMHETFTGGDPLSVGDGIYQILITLSRRCNNSRLLMDSLFVYLSGGYLSHGAPALCRLSEPLLWFILKVLDSSRMLKLFLEKGGIEVVCRNFVNCNSRIISTSPSLISTMMHNMNGKASTEKKKKWDTEATDGLQNFAPLGTIVSCSPTASPAEVLIVSQPQHRRARSAPWSYHFYPDEAWVDLKITLPFAILLKEVNIQPHSPALSTCPAFVSLEASQDGITSFPLCAPMNTGGLVYIKLMLQRPEVVTMVTIRLHKARDSMTIGLSQILLMGYSAFGEIGYKPTNLFLPSEDIVSRSSVGWVRLLHHCLTSQKDIESQVAEAAAPTQSLLHTCTALLVSPIQAIYSPTIEAVLLKLGLHSGEMGLALIDNLLRNISPTSESGLSSQYLGKMSGIANDSTVEILYQLGIVQDRWTNERVKAMLQWLGDSARVALQRKAVFSDNRFRLTPHEVSHLTLPGPAPPHVHCIAAVLWQSNEIAIEYNLCQLVTKDLVSSLYEWSSVLDTNSPLKKAVDYVLCSVCHICPDAFTRIMEWMGVTICLDFGGLTASISDEDKDSSQYGTTSLTDDSKEASNARGQSLDSGEQDPPITLQDFKHMCLDESHLSTLALACQSPLATKQLLESGFPAVLAQGLFEFCNRVISMFADSWSQPEGVSDSCKSMNGTSGDSGSSSQNVNGVCVTADMVAAVLNFFSEVSCSSAMKDWLGGADGNIFWPVLLTMLCNTPMHCPVAFSAYPQKYELMSAEDRAAIETASVSFFTNVISCHLPNQMLFAKVLYDVIKEQGASGKVGACPLSGFTRRLFLQVLLEDEKVLVVFRAGPPQYRIQVQTAASTGQIQHPHFGTGRRFRTLLVNMHMSVGELTNRVSDSPNLATQLLESQGNKKSDESKKETSRIGLELVENIYAAANSVEPGAHEKETSSTTAHGSKPGLARPPTRRGRNGADSFAKQFSTPELSLYHKIISNKTLPSDMTLSQLLQVLQQYGLPQGQCVLDFVLQIQSKIKDPLADDPDEIPEDVLLATTPFPTALQIFASVGGLALLAEHLPLLYPEISRQITSDTGNESTAGTSTDPNQDWVTVDSIPEDFDEWYEPMSPAPQANRGHNIGNPSIPPHSLVAFGLFLRLPGYAEVLLKERKKAQCLLRLVLGVTDNGDGGHILTSPIANSLPTLPFIVLKSLFDSTPLTTDDGVLLRRMCLEIGALHLILACLSILSHHAPRVSMPGFQQEAQSILSAMQPSATFTPTQIPYSTEEKSQQYWAKGTGFGTGSTTSSWDAEQALVRQRSEEEHVTCLLLVLASYINPGGHVPEDFQSEHYKPQSEKSLLADIVPEMLTHSCLIPALSSYLRNDSVLDMARHVPLYRALLQLLRGISVCPSLVMLLLPMDKGTNSDSAAAVGELLEKMRGCVDTYASRLKSNKGKVIGTKEEEEENEGLAMLIPDIQRTATIVHTATERIKEDQDHSHGAGSDGTKESDADGTRGSFDEIYLADVRKLQFDQYEMVREENTSLKFLVRHHYENNVKAAGDIKNPNRIRRLAQEAVTLSTSLPLSVSSSVFVRCDEERLDIMKVLITGPEDTPYANGCFEFDVYFPQDYPNAPPYINLETTGNHTVRFNPNLYNDGKVCLSILNTWHGRPEEKWSAQTSSFLQVLVSIQSLILVCEPYFNEPGYERSRGTPSGTASSREYDANIRQATVKWAILEQQKNPSPCFKEVIQRHFWMKRHRILRQCEQWIAEMELYSSDKRTGRTIAHSALALKKHYNQLREEFAKAKVPEGLENMEQGDIDPKEKHYQTGGDVTQAGAGPSSSKDIPQAAAANATPAAMFPPPPSTSNSVAAATASLSASSLLKKTDFSDIEGPSTPDC